MAPSNSWSAEQRLALHLLNTQFSLDADARAAVFNRIFNKDLTVTALSSAYRDRLRADRAHLWAPALIVPKSVSEIAKRQDMGKRIRAAAAISDSTNPTATATSSSRPATRVKARPAAQNANDRLYTAETVPMLDSPRKKRPLFGVKAQQPLTNTHATHHRDESESARGARAPPDSIRGPSQPAAVHQANDSQHPTQLKMVHFKQIVWDGNQPYWSFGGGGEVPPNSPTYKHGGWVHRVIVGLHQTADFMICDPTACTTCNEGYGFPPSLASTNLPRVHVSDIGEHNGEYFFRPLPKAHSTVFKPLQPKTLQFDVFGDVTAKIMMCDFAVCGACPPRDLTGAAARSAQAGS